jgi:hypothetical protein
MFKPKPTSNPIDPIFAAIDAHRRTWANLIANVSELDEQGKQRAVDRLWRQVDKAAAALIEITPTSIAGASALLTYAADHVSAGEGWGQFEDGHVRSDGDGVPWEVLLHRNLAAALPNIAPSAA